MFCVFLEIMFQVSVFTAVQLNYLDSFRIVVIFVQVLPSKELGPLKTGREEIRSDKIVIFQLDER